MPKRRHVIYQPRNKRQPWVVCELLHRGGGLLRVRLPDGREDVLDETLFRRQGR